MQVQWDVGGVGSFDSHVLVTPGRQNFQQGGVYRLKLTGLTGRDGIELYPTLAIYPASARSAAYLAHNAIPVQFTDQDLDQVIAGNFVTKAVYIPDPEFQELAVGVDTLVSSPVDPGLDPIVEADRRGTILAVIRVGNKDLETPDAVSGEIIQASFNPAARSGVRQGDRNAACWIGCAGFVRRHDLQRPELVRRHRRVRQWWLWQRMRWMRKWNLCQLH